MHRTWMQRTWMHLTQMHRKQMHHTRIHRTRMHPTWMMMFIALQCTWMIVSYIDGDGHDHDRINDDADDHIVQCTPLMIVIMMMIES